MAGMSPNHTSNERALVPICAPRTIPLIAWLISSEATCPPCFAHPGPARLELLTPGCYFSSRLAWGLSRCPTRDSARKEVKNIAINSMERDAPELLTGMYEALHAEINTRLEQRQGVLTFTLLVAASLFGLGLQSWASAVTVLCYPVLGLFLALVWEQHDTKIGQIAAYLRELEERHLGEFGPGWECWRRQRFPVKHHHIETPAKGVFVASEVLAMVIGIARMAGQLSSLATIMLAILLLLLDIGATTLTWAALKHQRERGN